MKRITARPAILGLVASAVILVVWYQLLWSPQGAAIAAAHHRERTATDGLFIAEQKLGHLKKVASKAPQLTLIDQKLSAAIPDHDAIDQFILDLDAEARASNVTIASFGVTPPGKATTAAGGASGTQPISVQMQLSGGYFDVQHFFGALRDAARLFVIDQVSLSGTPAKPGAPPANGSTVQVTLAGRLFVTSAAAPAITFAAPASTSAKQGTGVLETPINAARNAAASSNAATSQAGGTP
jgi:Tfp pilus assembly protein PilO